MKKMTVELFKFDGCFGCSREDCRFNSKVATSDGKTMKVRGDKYKCNPTRK